MQVPNNSVHECEGLVQETYKKVLLLTESSHVKKRGVTRLGNAMGVTRMGWHQRRGRVKGGMLRNRANDSISNMGSPKRIST